MYDHIKFSIILFDSIINLPFLLWYFTDYHFAIDNEKAMIGLSNWKIGGQLQELKNLLLSLQSDINYYRKNNLMIFGLPEQNQDDTPQKRMQKDKNDVENIVAS